MSWLHDARRRVARPCGGRDACDGSAKADLFLVGQEAYASSTLRLSANARRRIPLDLLVVDTNPEDVEQTVLRLKMSPKRAYNLYKSEK